MRRFLLTFPVLFLLVPVTARAVPPLINHEGLLLDEAGLPLEGNHTLTFTIHDAAQDGVALWTADVALQLLDGYYQVLLGLAPQGFPASLFDGSTRYLGLAIDHGAQLTPRRQLASVPYALQAKHAAVADNATGNITPSGINLSSGGSIAIDGATVVHTDRKITPSSLAIGATTVIDAGGKVLPSSIDVKAGGNIAIGGSEVIDSARRWRGAPIDAGNVVGRVGDASSFDGHPLSDFIVMTDPNGAKAKLSQLEVDADTLGSKAPAHYLSFQDAAHEAAADAPRQVLDWLKSIPAAGAPIPALDADLLDGKHGTDFLGATATAVNSDKLDGKHASAFLGFAEGMSDPAQQILAWLSSLNAPLAIDAHL
ncbi:MAG: hypothetical protein FJ125_17700, partial [Deltaproteobacteria bacterium]|nr:hypothetical protein [Deltaproteobacteria bacterium]